MDAAVHRAIHSKKLLQTYYVPDVISRQERFPVFSNLESSGIFNLDESRTSYQHFPPKTSRHSLFQGVNP